MITEYESQHELNPSLWIGHELRPKVRVGLIKIAKAFYDFLEVDVDILDVILIGSNANYNWTRWSDIDLHVVINYMNVGDNMHIVSNYMHAKKSVWNVNYPLQYQGMNIELYAQDSNQELHSSVGIFSLMNNKWLNQPNAEQISIDDAAIQNKTEPYEFEIDSLKDTDPQADKKIASIKQRLRHLRQTGLDTEGEYSIENMAYKHLRNHGYLERLKQLEQKIKRGRLSLEHAVNELNVPAMANNAKDQVKKFVGAIKTETSETKQAMAMLLQHLNGDKLTPEQWKWVRNQMKDVIKVLGLTTMAIAPGGSLVAMLAKVLKADKYMLPSSMQPDDHKEITEELIMHITGKKKLEKSGWDNIIKKTSAVVDPMGQWNHPGKCTMIQTPNGGITMRNVPHPVLGIDDTGHMLMMQPEHDYKFPGQDVFEIPHTAQYQTMIMQLTNTANNGSIYAK